MKQANSTVIPTHDIRLPKQRFIDALERRLVPGLVPHFELNVFLTMEIFGKVHPSQRVYHQWDQMSETERQLHRMDIAKLYIDTAELFCHDAILLHVNPNTLQESQRLIDLIRDQTGDRFCLMMHGDCTYGIPSGEQMVDFCYQMVDEPKKLEAQAVQRTDKALERASKLRDLDGFVLCADYCFNNGPFLSLEQFDEFVMPSLCRVIEEYRRMGFYVIKHTDGNIMPILDRLIQSNPHALHSLDPQGGVDMAEMVRLAGDKVALCGNVHCGLMQTGTDQEVVASAEYALKNGLKAPGYIFSTSNCIYTGMPLKRYELILDVWRKHGVRQ